MNNSNYARPIENMGIISDISEWKQSDVLNWLRDLNLSNLLSNFEENKINGYDLCMLTNAILKEELRINSFHDRNLILRSIKENLILQCKIN
jgi:hypothetical protein